MKTKFYAACAVLAVFLSSTTAGAQDRPVCPTPHYFWTLQNLPASYGYETSIAEDRQLSDAERDAYDAGTGRDWIALMQKMDLPSLTAPERWGGECDFNSALAAFSNLSRDVSDTGLQKIWLVNQDRVLATCQGGEAPALDYPADTPPRLAREAQYQFLARDYHIAKKAKDGVERQRLSEGFRAIGMTPGHPRARDALRTMLRLVYDMRGLDAAWDETERLRTDPVTQNYWPELEDIRFELMTRQRMGESDDGKDSIAAQAKILPWLMEVVRTRTATEGMGRELARARWADAVHNLRWYLPADRTPDWFLQAQTSGSEMLNAAKAQIAVDDLLALMAAEAVQRPSLQSRAHDRDAAVLSSKQRLSNYAFAKFKECKGPEWLPVALRFAVAGQPELNAILRAAHDALNDAMLEKSRPDFTVYLWSELLQAELLAGHDDTAIQLSRFRRTPDDWALGSLIESGPQDMIAWYIHRGEYDLARKTYRANPELGGTQIFRVMLAQTPDELRAALSASGLADDRLRPVFNLLPIAELQKLKPGDLSPAVDRTILTRAYLLDKSDIFRRTALKLHRESKGGDKSLIAMLDGDDLDRTLFFLSHPRMRGTGPGFDTETPWWDDGIDSFNPNDNNWWCRLNPAQEKKDLLELWALREYSDEKPAADEFTEKRRVEIEKHPLFKMIDADETRAMADIPAAPVDLTARAVRAAGGKFAWAKTWKNDDRIPEALHLAVRVTRYGCRKDGSHGDASRAAYRLLHRYYGKTGWAEATPYWFDGRIKSDWP